MHVRKNPDVSVNRCVYIWKYNGIYTPFWNKLFEISTMLSLQWHCENFKLLWPNRNFWMCWIYSILSFVLSRWNSQTSGPLAISGPRNTPVLHHCCPTSHLSLSSCTAFNTALFYLAKCGLTGRPVTFQRCRTILKSVIVRNQSFFSMCCERNTMAAVVLWPRGSSRRNPILKAIRVFEAAFLRHSCGLRHGCKSFTTRYAYKSAK